MQHVEDSNARPRSIDSPGDHTPLLKRLQAIQAHRIISAALVSALPLACTPADSPEHVKPRLMQTQPVKTALQTPLSAGKAEALFRLDTGGDQMTEALREAGLVAVVRVGADEYRQTIVSCPDPGLGSALGGGTERELEIVICNGEYLLVSEPGLVSVVRIENGAEGAAVARFELPAGVRATRPKGD